MTNRAQINAGPDDQPIFRDIFKKIFKEFKSYRLDVNSKNILRAARHYYDFKLEKTFCVKKTRRKMSRTVQPNKEPHQGFTFYTDKLTQLMFPVKILIEVFDVKDIDVSNHMAALISSKPLLAELETHQKGDFAILPRLGDIDSICKNSRDLLYKYNKQKLQIFLQSIHNLVLLENFMYFSVKNLKIMRGNPNEISSPALNSIKFQEYFLSKRCVKKRGNK